MGGPGPCDSQCAALGETAGEPSLENPRYPSLKPIALKPLTRVYDKRPFTRATNRHNRELELLAYVVLFKGDMWRMQQ